MGTRNLQTKLLQWISKESESTSTVFLCIPVTIQGPITLTTAISLLILQSVKCITYTRLYAQRTGRWQSANGSTEGNSMNFSFRRYCSMHVIPPLILLPPSFVHSLPLPTLLTPLLSHSLTYSIPPSLSHTHSLLFSLPGPEPILAKPVIPRRLSWTARQTLTQCSAFKGNGNFTNENLRELTTSSVKTQHNVKEIQTWT